MSLLREAGPVHIDDLSMKSRMPVSKASSLLLQLEFAGVVKSRPGKVYELSR